MPIAYMRQLSGRDRSPSANRHLALCLAFNAGAVNAGGFLAVHQYTSHMSGIVAGMADHLALGDLSFLFSGLGFVLSFLMGAATSAIVINWGRRRALHSEFALALMVEAVLLLLFGFLGVKASGHTLFVPLIVSLLCYIMGLQNAMITKLSKSEIRTTHVTGIVTDIGIEMGKLLYVNRRNDTNRPPVLADRARLRVLTSLLLLFFVGGVAGALGFKHGGFMAIIPLACMLVIIAAVPLVDDIKQWKSL